MISLYGMTGYSLTFNDIPKVRVGNVYQVDSHLKMYIYITVIHYRV